MKKDKRPPVSSCEGPRRPRGTGASGDENGVRQHRKTPALQAINWPTKVTEHFLSSFNHTVNDMQLIEKIFSTVKARETFFNFEKWNSWS